jgi:hypothetical protein
LIGKASVQRNAVTATSPPALLPYNPPETATPVYGEGHRRTMIHD